LDNLRQRCKPLSSLVGYFSYPNHKINASINLYNFADWIMANTYFFEP
jgi:hypothetical protein